MIGEKVIESLYEGGIGEVSLVYSKMYCYECHKDNMNVLTLMFDQDECCVCECECACNDNDCHKKIRIRHYIGCSECMIQKLKELNKK